MNWLSFLLKALQAAPATVAGIEMIHASAPGATKLQLVRESLGLATAVGTAILPDHEAAIAQSVSAAANTVIAGIVQGFHATGAFPAHTTVPTAS